MFYISRHEWDISLLTLLYSEDIDVVKFVAGITKGAECKISFEYNNTNIKKWDGTEIEGFIEKLKEKSTYNIESFRATINEINFIDQPDMVHYLDAEMSADEFLVKLRMIMPEDCKPHETIVFFDEIQKCPEIVTKIKFLVDEGSFKYVMSGSLLGVELKGIASAPVGYLSVLRMYPMDFEEFMIANLVSKATLEMLKDKFETVRPVDEFIHQKLLALFFVFWPRTGSPLL